MTIIQALSIIGAFTLSHLVYDFLKELYRLFFTSKKKSKNDSDVVIKITVDSTDTVKELERIQKEIAKIKFPSPTVSVNEINEVFDKRQRKDR